MMNILFVSGMFANNENTVLGGMAKAVYVIASGMQQRGNKVKVLSIGNTQNREWKYKGIDVISIPVTFDPNIQSDYKYVLQTFDREIQFQKEITRINSEWKIDIIHYSGWYAVGMLHYRHIPAVMRISSYSRIQLSTNYSSTRNKILQITEKLALKRMNAVYVPAKITADAIFEDIHKKVYVLETPFVRENVVYDDEFYKKNLSDERYILFFGRLSSDKGIDVVRNSMTNILSKNPDISYVFIGYDSVEQGVSKKEELMRASRQYKGRVIISPGLPHEELYPVIKNSEIVLIPSLVDNLPNSCAESMSEGAIVIGTNGSSLEQYIRDGYNGFLAEIGDSGSLSEKITQALSMTVEEKNVIKGNAKKSLNKFSEERFFNKLEQLLNAVK